MTGHTNMFEIQTFAEDFIIIGQKMADGDGVVVLVGKPGVVNMREIFSLKNGESVSVTMTIEPGYQKFRADTFQQAMDMIRNR